MSQQGRKTPRDRDVPLDPEEGRLDAVTELFTQYRQHVQCVNCDSIGRFNKDSANGRRRYKCQGCQKTCSVSGMLRLIESTLKGGGRGQERPKADMVVTKRPTGVVAKEKSPSPSRRSPVRRLSQPDPEPEPELESDGSQASEEESMEEDVGEEEDEDEDQDQDQGGGRWSEVVTVAANKKRRWVPTRRLPVVAPVPVQTGNPNRYVLLKRGSTIEDRQEDDPVSPQKCLDCVNCRDLAGRIKVLEEQLALTKAGGSKNSKGTPVVEEPEWVVEIKAQFKELKATVESLKANKPSPSPQETPVAVVHGHPQRQQPQQPQQPQPQQPQQPQQSGRRPRLTYAEVVAKMALPEDADKTKAIEALARLARRRTSYGKTGVERLDGTHKVKRVYVDGFPHMKIGELKQNLFHLRICLTKIHFISYIGRSLLEFLVSEDYVGAFKRRMEAMEKTIVERHDPMKALDPNASEAVKRRVTESFMARLARSSVTARSAVARAYYADWVAELQASSTTNASTTVTVTVAATESVGQDPVLGASVPSTAVESQVPEELQEDNIDGHGEMSFVSAEDEPQDVSMIGGVTINGSNLLIETLGSEAEFEDGDDEGKASSSSSSKPPGAMIALPSQ